MAYTALLQSTVADLKWQLCGPMYSEITLGHTLQERSVQGVTVFSL